MRLVALAALCLMVAACGQRGPLYLRDNPPPGVKPEKRDTYKPVPYPPSMREEESK
jgi:predicted small lipoprotein YifL